MSAMPTGDDKRKQSRGHAHWMMIACCVPMLVIAIALVATGVAGTGFIFAAVMCTVMMIAMMSAMSGGNQNR